MEEERRQDRRAAVGWMVAWGPGRTGRLRDISNGGMALEVLGDDSPTLGGGNEAVSFDIQAGEESRFEARGRVVHRRACPTRPHSVIVGIRFDGIPRFRYLMDPHETA